MGAGNFNLKKYRKQAEKATKREDAGFNAKAMCEEFNPVRVTTRFSKSGPFNHFRKTTTVLVGLDVTGSMGQIPKSLLKGGLGNLMVDLQSIYNGHHENLQLSFAGIGDAKSDVSPLQVTHFESDNRFALQLPKIWLEGGGGANGAESYNLLWWYAANKTTLNYIERDNRKGILITIGDDNVHDGLTAMEVQMWLDSNYMGGDISNEVLLNAAREQYEIYHIVIQDGHAHTYDFLTHSDKSAEQIAIESQRWRDLLGDENVIFTTANQTAQAIAEIVSRHRTDADYSLSDLTKSEWEVHNFENLSDLQWTEVLSYTLCPLSHEYMTHPIVWGNNKRAYERDSVASYMQKFGTDPITGQTLPSNFSLKPNLNIAQLCLDYKPYYDALDPARREQLVDNLFPSADPESPREPISHDEMETHPLPIGLTAASSSDAAETISLTCPLTLELMVTPVIVIATGQTYEKSAIEEWFASHDTDPNTGQTLTDKSLVVNYALKSLCDMQRMKQISDSDNMAAGSSS